MLSKIQSGLKAIWRREIGFDIDLIPYEFKKLPLKKIANWLKKSSARLTG